MRKASFRLLPVVFGLLTTILQGFGSGNPSGRQGADPGFNAHVARPAYPNRRPRVLFDEAHNNADTSLGRYKPFTDLVTSDGYSVVPGTRSFSRAALTGFDVAVIVNAAGPGSQKDASPFTEEECDSVRDWVSAGGSLLLISDNAPFSAAIAKLSKRFNVELTEGYTIDTSKYSKDGEDQSELLFTRDDGLLGEHPINSGRDTAERINRVISYSGTSLKGPDVAVPLLKLSDTAVDILPPDRKPTPDNPSPDHRQVSAAGRAQGIALKIGKGRVVVLGEAAMLTAQVAPRGFRFGMNVPGIDNRQFALNIMHWLSGLLR